MNLRFTLFPLFCKTALILAGSLLAGILFVKFLFQVTLLGHYIPQNDLVTDYVVALFWVAGLGVSILFWPVSTKDKKALLWVWLAKSLVALGFMLFYENHYNLDAYWYYERGLAPFSPASLKFWAAPEDINLQIIGNQNVTNLVHFFRYFLMVDSYHAVKLSFAMMGLAGIYLFYRAAVVFTERENLRLFYILAFCPSIIFWSSVVGKEPITFFGMALYVYGVVSWYRHSQSRYLLMMVFGILIASMIRVWYGAIMFLPLGLFLFWDFRNVKSRAVLTIIMATIFLLISGSFFRRFKIETIQDILTSIIAVGIGFATTPGGSTIQIDFTNFTPTNLLFYIPVGMFTALFRPLPGEVLNPFGTLAGLENLGLLILLFLAIKRTALRELKNPILIWALFLVLEWSLLNAFILNLGTLVRFKLQIFPIFLCLLLYFARKRPSLSQNPAEEPLT